MDIWKLRKSQAQRSTDIPSEATNQQARIKMEDSFPHAFLFLSSVKHSYAIITK